MAAGPDRDISASGLINSHGGILEFLKECIISKGRLVSSTYFCTVYWRMAVFRPTPTFGRYVQVQIVKGESNYMSPAEVLVWGRKVRYH